MTASPDSSGTYDRTRATQAGLDLHAVDALVERAHREIDAGLLPSCQLALARDGEVVVDVTLGDAAPDSRYVIFSCTKAIVGSGVWRLLSDGRLTADTKVVEVVPSFGTNGKDVITVEQLLTHTSGFPRAPLGPPAWADREQRLEAFARWSCNWDPGTRFEYHPTAAHWVLAEIIEAVTGTDYRAWIRDEVLRPLGLEGIQLGLPDGDADPAVAFADVRPVTIVGERPTPDELEEAIGIRLDLEALIGEVTSEAKVMLGQPEQMAVGVPGGGGVSRAADFALFYQALLHDQLGLWSPEVLHAATAEVHCDLPDPLRGNPAHRTLGLILSGDDEAKAMRGFGFTVSGRAFGHDGAGGQIAYADPANGLSFCYFTDGHDEHLIREWRRTAGIASKAGLCAAAA